MWPVRGKESKTEYNGSYLYNPVVLLEPCCVASDLCRTAAIHNFLLLCLSHTLPYELKQPV